MRAQLDKLGRTVMCNAAASADVRDGLRWLREFEEFAEGRFEASGKEEPELAALSMKHIAEQALTAVGQATQFYRRGGARGATLAELRLLSVALADAREVYEAALTAAAMFHGERQSG